MAVTMLNMPNVNMKSATISRDFQPCFSRNVSIINTNNASSAKQEVIAPTLVRRVMETKAAKRCSRLALIWREIQGLNDWENLVQPLNPLLRKEVIRYGEFVTACYKAFELDQNSKRYLNCKYGKKTMLQEVGLGDSGYEVTKYIYATPDINIPVQNSSCPGRWVGYVAVSNDNAIKKLGRRDILITFRGTVTNPEWMANLMSSLIPARLDPHDPRPDVKVEAGFLSLYTSTESGCKFGLESCRDQLLSEVSRLINKYKGEEISITLAGHSMGSSLALLLAYDLTELGLNRRYSANEIPVTVFSFGGPRVGNSAFKERCEELGVKVLRIVNEKDPITKLPGVFFNESLRDNFEDLCERFQFPLSCTCYAHVGVELLLDFFKVDNPSCVHDLDTYIGLLKCPKSLKVHQEGIDLIQKVKDLVMTTRQKINMLPGKNVALNMLNLVQSQRA